MTSSNGNIFRVTGPLFGEFTGPGEFPTQRPVTWSFDVFFDVRLNKRLSKQPQGWWFETQSWSLWRHCNVLRIINQKALLESTNWQAISRWISGLFVSPCNTSNYPSLILDEVLLNSIPISIDMRGMWPVRVNYVMTGVLLNLIQFLFVAALLLIATVGIIALYVI